MSSQGDILTKTLDKLLKMCYSARITGGDDHSKNIIKVMTTENIDITNGDGTQEVSQNSGDSNPVELTPEQLAAKVEELKGFNERLLQENKQLKGTKKEETPTEPKKETKTEEVKESSSLPLRDVAMIAELSKEYSIEELEKAQEFVGGPLGNSLQEVASNVGFKAVIAKEREESQSKDMIEETTMELKPLETKDSIIRDIEAGVIDYKKPGNEKYREIYAKHMASQLD